MNVNQPTTDARGAPVQATRTESGIRVRLSRAMFRAQLGPSREDAWRNFSPRR
jgi:hypothetical protein